MTIKKLWKNYNLSIVLFVLFISSWIFHGLYQWRVYQSEAESHQQQPTVSDFFDEFAASTFENWQSEFLQLFSMVVLTAYLVHKGSAESTDSTVEMQQSLNRIEKQLKTLRTK